MVAKTKFDISLENLLEAGVHFGHQTRRWNSKMGEYIYGSREGVHIFDLAKTREALIEAYEAVREKVAEGGIVLFVGTKRQAKDLVGDAAKKVDMPYITLRWPGGFITNFTQIKKSLKKLEELTRDRDAGKFKNHTKKERLLIDREIGRLERSFGGVKNLNELPDMLFIVDTYKEDTAVREAGKKGIPVVGIVDTNSDPEPIDYPIPGNDDAVKSIAIILDCIVEAVEEGQAVKKKEDKKNESKEQK